MIGPSLSILSQYILRIISFLVPPPTVQPFNRTRHQNVVQAQVLTDWRIHVVLDATDRWTFTEVHVIAAIRNVHQSRGYEGGFQVKWLSQRMSIRIISTFSLVDLDYYSKNILDFDSFIGTTLICHDPIPGVALVSCTCVLKTLRCQDMKQVFGFKEGAMLYLTHRVPTGSGN